MEGIKVLIADDHTVVRKGIRALLETEPGIRVVGEAEDGEDALHKALALRPDVILMDLVMPKLDGVKATHEVRERLPTAKVLVLTSFAEDRRIRAAIEAGALGYLLKDSSPQDLVRAIREVARGGSALHPKVAQRLIRQLQGPREESVREGLTERETRVLELIAQGLSNREVARELSISEPTVRTHVSNILRKLHLKSRTQAALYALKEGLAQLEEKD
ncbi:MAG: NarL family two-component response regulator [Acetothermia bacterium 64_32]|nr:MAG: NarL family two-component response regulator [Acetothermia bacterium 64_32]HAF70125.1 DNA-binding response regulator [Candidatus Acetothermia bacterium]